MWMDWHLAVPFHWLDSNQKPPEYLLPSQKSRMLFFWQFRSSLQKNPYSQVIWKHIYMVNHTLGGFLQVDACGPAVTLLDSMVTSSGMLSCKNIFFLNNASLKLNWKQIHSRITLYWLILNFRTSNNLHFKLLNNTGNYDGIFMRTCFVIHHVYFLNVNNFTIKIIS